MLNKKNCGGRTIARTIGKVNICRSEIVAKTIIIVIAIVSNPESLSLRLSASSVLERS